MEKELESQPSDIVKKSIKRRKKNEEESQKNEKTTNRGKKEGKWESLYCNLINTLNKIVTILTMNVSSFEAKPL
jgi:hypothetical protein